MSDYLKYKKISNKSNSCEILNLNYRKRILVLNVLNRVLLQYKAAIVLDVSDRTLFNLIKEYNIIKDGGKFKVKK